MPTWLCLWGVTKRVFTNYGKTREDMGGCCPERFDRNKLELFRHVLNFNREHRKTYYALLERANVTVFRNRRQVKDYLEKL